MNDTPANTRVMSVVHNALRRDLARTRAALTGPMPPHDEQRVAIGEHLLWMMGFLHNHHSSEDATIYPAVRERDASAAALLDQMHADHQSVVPAIAQLEAAAKAYIASPDATDDVIAALDAIEAVLLPHLEREEIEMMPIVARNITQREWDDWEQEYNVKPLDKKTLAMTGLWLIDGCDAADTALITALVPPLPRWIITHVVVRTYRKQAFRRWRTQEFSPFKLAVDGAVEVTTSASPQAVWSIVSDPTRVGEWSHECFTAEWLDGADAPAIGARFRGTNKSGSVRWSRPCTIRLFDPERRFGFLTDGGVMGDNSEWCITLTPVDGGGTRIAQYFRIVSGRLVVDRLLYAFIKAHRDRSAALRGDLERLGALAAKESPARV
jgi:uncharacterized protein YndB with AHSA1/START domain